MTGGIIGSGVSCCLAGFANALRLVSVKRYGWLLLLLAQGGVAAEPSLKEAYRGDFYIGASLGDGFFGKRAASERRIVDQQFNSVTSANMLKWQRLNPQPGVFRHEIADAYVDFGSSRRMYVVGHVLFWHNQTPDWVFQNDQGKRIGRRQLLERMSRRVRHVAKRYNTHIDAWDVVNEAYLDNGKLRDSPWTRVIGDDYIEQAFRIAGRELPAGVELIYNDYGMTQPGKRQAVVKMIRSLKEKRVRIDGVGMQAHWSLEWPGLEEIEKSIVAYAACGVDVHITELDIDVLPREPGMFAADIELRGKLNSKNNPYPEGLPEGVQRRLTERYAEIFRLFLKHRDKIKRVTFWGVTDKDSWLNNWPVKGRTNYPLLFDRKGLPKPAYDAVMKLKAESIRDPK